MKKLVLSAAAAACLFAACKKSDDAHPITGKWYLDYTSIQVKTDGTSTLDTNITATPSGQYFDFATDSTLYEYLYDTAGKAFYTDSLRYQRTADQVITSRPETMMIKTLNGSNLTLYTSWTSSSGTATVFTETWLHLHK